jgi:hypothetical protein
MISIFKIRFESKLSSEFTTVVMNSDERGSSGIEPVTPLVQGLLFGGAGAQFLFFRRNVH